jgi:hypothetical protein
MAIIPLQASTGRILGPHKAVQSARYDARTVLTNSPWEFVSLWLKREGRREALILWNQAREFHEASSGLTLQSVPLLHYYSFMNATKALLTAKGIAFDPIHGIGADNLRGVSSKIKLANEGVRIRQNGVLPALSGYFGEVEARRNHSLKELLFNLPYVHRTYCLTYTSQRDMFVPLKDCMFVADSVTGEAFFRANVSESFPMRKLQNRLPPTFVREPAVGPRALRSTAHIVLHRPRRLTPADLNKIATFNRQMRIDVHYINAAQTLWYLKLRETRPRRLERLQLTLTLAAMHRLSEICRYRPLELAAFMSSQENWLLSEFVQSSPGQFLDAIASEMTGYQFLLPNIRPAT